MVRPHAGFRRRPKTWPHRRPRLANAARAKKAAVWPDDPEAAPRPCDALTGCARCVSPVGISRPGAGCRPPALAGRHDGPVGVINRKEKAVRRTAPMALVLYSLIVVWFHQVGHRYLQFPDRP